MGWYLKQIGLFLLIGLAAGTFSRAQLLPDPVSLTASPSSPSPGESFVVVATTPTFDRNAAFFEWTVDGRPRPDLSGLGKDSLNLVARGVGEVTQVAVSITRDGGEGGSSSLAVYVADLALPWFSETLVPPWYKGKALPVPNSIVNIVALPNFVTGGKIISYQNLIYTWSLDDDDRALSGIGKNVFAIKTSGLPKASHRIRVTVEDQNKTIRKEDEVFIVPTSPDVSAYRATPLGGVESRLATGILSTALRGLLDFVVEPFFFPVKSKKDLSYRWEVAGRAVSGTPERPYVLTVDTAGLAAGGASLSVEVDDRDDLVPSALKNVTLFLE